MTVAGKIVAIRRSLVSFSLVALALAACGAPRKEPVLGLDCEDGALTPIASVPEAEWPTEVTGALTAMGDRWAGSFGAMLHCSGLADATVQVRVSTPESTTWVLYRPPEVVPSNSAYICLAVAGGEGRITVEGLRVDGQAIALEDLPLKLRIEKEDTTFPGLVDGEAQLALSGTTWDELALKIWIDRAGARGGNLLLSRGVAQGAGEAMDCTMEDGPQP
jgi:hypothetical protein